MKVINTGISGITFDLGESIEADTESIRQAMIAEAAELRKLKSCIETSDMRSAFDRRLAERLEYYAKYLKMK